MASEYLCYIEETTDFQGGPVYRFRAKVYDKPLAIVPFGEDDSSAMPEVFDCFVDCVRQMSTAVPWAAELFLPHGDTSVRVMGNTAWIDDDAIFLSLDKEYGFQIERAPLGDEGGTNEPGGVGIVEAY